MHQKLKIIPVVLLEEYLKQVSVDITASFDNLREAEISTNTFSFYTSVSAIASSRIEGEQMEIDGFVKHKMLDIEYLPDLVQKPNDLYGAYLFAQQNDLTDPHFLATHKLITKHLLPAVKQGKPRTGNMVVMEHNTGCMQFEAAPASRVKELLDLLWTDIKQLKKESLSTPEVFYFASFIHLVFVDIHPFEDGNGRAGRLLEKWFIAEKLGRKAWYLQSELNYYNNINQYYKNLNQLGVFYDELDYTKAIPFLLMLPQSLDLNNQ
ncbi:Fic family protein [Mucilaginibacter sp. BJC16-A38]|uniref:Fic family protein n=1 Tax=Mucilaginibacter phenanthrenivorans TaxID=1234842 RepID=UPI0021579C00|nr:Fic family protein [Mucilaginibacter phenanthrenivorans]MCR8560958.1 Fic family protein [Mucilaginibacter phenanthrenivorans]